MKKRLIVSFVIGVLLGYWVAISLGCFQDEGSYLWQCNFIFYSLPLLAAIAAPMYYVFRFFPEVWTLGSFFKVSISYTVLILIATIEVFVVLVIANFVTHFVKSLISKREKKY